MQIRARLLWILVGCFQAVSAQNPAEVELSRIKTNGIHLQVAEQGAGPLVILLHGFPELWYSWRKQLPVLAQAGYHAVAPDMRGYGGSDRPSGIENYDVIDLCGDVTGLIEALGGERAVVVGHDWGAAVAWYCALLEPQRFRGLVTMSVPWAKRRDTPPLPRIRQVAGDNFNYMLFFQEPGVAEAELEGRTREFLTKVFVSPGAPRDPPRITDQSASAGGFIDRLGMPKTPPSWLSQEDLEYFVSEFERTGFASALHYYRNLDRNWELTPHTADRLIEIPTLFLAGDREFLIRGRSKTDLERSMREIAPQVRVEILHGGVGHWLQEERSDTVNALLIDFLKDLNLNGRDASDAPPEEALYAGEANAIVRTVAELPAATGGISVDRGGDIFVADIGPAPERRGTTVYRVTPDGVLGVFATGFLGASGNAFDSEGNLFQANLRRHSISRVTQAGEVSTFASDGIVVPVGIAIDPDDNLYVANCGSNTIQKVGTSGVSSLYASSEQFNCPNGITLDPEGNVYVANFLDGRVLKVSPDGSVGLFATVPGGNNGHIVYGNGMLYVVARGAHQIYTLSLSGDLQLLAGTGKRGNQDGPALKATFSLPNDVDISPGGDVLYINQVGLNTGTDNHPTTIRAIRLDGG